MKRTSTIFLQCVIVLVAVLTLVILLRFPLSEGRNVEATLSEVYFQDPFLAYIYLASLAVFVGFYQAFVLLKLIRRDNAFTAKAVKAARILKYCALIFIGFMLGAEAYLFIVMRGQDDIAGAAMFGLILILVSLIIAAAANLLQHVLQSAAAIEPENKPGTDPN